MVRGEWGRPPLWAVILMVVCAATLAIGLPLTANRGHVDAATLSSNQAGAPTPDAAATEPSLVNDDGTIGPIVALGDSITAGVEPDENPTDVPPNAVSTESWYSQALDASAQLVGGYNAGVPGDVTANMITRFQRDVTAHSPRVVVILGGTNDLFGETTPEEVVGNLQRLAELTRGIGAVPVLGTIPPRAEGELATEIAALNAAIRGYGQASGTLVIDFYAAVATDDSDWLPGMTDDGIHPTVEGAQAMGAAAVVALTQQP